MSAGGGPGGVGGCCKEPVDPDEVNPDEPYGESGGFVPGGGVALLRSVPSLDKV